LPPIWIGGSNPRAIDRAIEFGDGFIIGAAGVQRMSAFVPELRKKAEAAGKKTYPIGGLAYCVIGDDPETALQQAERPMARYYGTPDASNVTGNVHAGPVDFLAQTVKEYEQTGLDVLYLFPELADLKQVEAIAETILPPYRVPAR
jgi:alkanesulfonate monooxygenase SsuD/methylene tetrahydromethanopterin reductase-like flavin-dependent oxidoreductase (luciferase family)